jgi:hypothetical protein
MVEELLEEEIEEDEDERRESDPPNRIRRYGILWKPLHHLMECDPRWLSQIPPEVQKQWYDFYIELWSLKKKESLPSYKGFEHHFRELVMIVWGDPEWEFSWEWNPYVTKMLRAAIKYKFLGIAGHASSGKSMFGMLWGLVNWLIAPETTKVFITSTTLEDSRGRIWGDLERYWHKFSDFFGGMPQLLPGDLVSSKGYIRSRINGKKSQKAGIALIAGAKGQEKDSAKKIGFKAQNVIMIADELPLLSEELIKSAKGNLFSNPQFQFVGIGNPTSKYDPFGTFVEPLDGYETINEDSDEWPIKLGGICLRFDGKKSPNVVAGRTIWKGLLTIEKYEFYVKNLGTDSLEFWQMVRGYFSPTGAIGAIFWEADFEKYRMKRQVKEWVSNTEDCATLDPSFTHEGDGAIATFGKYGKAQYDQDGVDIRVTGEVVEQLDYNPLISKELNKAEECARLFAEDVKKRGIHVSNVALDITGGGISFVPLLAKHLGYGFLQVNFGGNASEMPISKADPRPSKERFSNHVTELWYVCKEIAKGEQLAGLTRDTIVELCSRTYKLVGKGQAQVLSKKEMKKHGMKSPDYADSWVLFVELGRRRHHLSSAEVFAKAPKKEDVTPDAFKWGLKKRNRPTVARTLSMSRGAVKMTRNLSS